MIVLLFARTMDTSGSILTYHTSQCWYPDCAGLPRRSDGNWSITCRSSVYQGRKRLPCIIPCGPAPVGCVAWQTVHCFNGPGLPCNARNLMYHWAGCLVQWHGCYRGMPRRIAPRVRWKTGTMRDFGEPTAMAGNTITTRLVQPRIIVL